MVEIGSRLLENRVFTLISSDVDCRADEQIKPADDCSPERCAWHDTPATSIDFRSGTAAWRRYWRPEGSWALLPAEPAFSVLSSAAGVLRDQRECAGADTARARHSPVRGKPAEKRRQSLFR